MPATTVEYLVPIPRSGSSTFVFEVEVEIHVGDWTTCARVVRLSAGEWEWRLSVDEPDGAPGLTAWEQDYLRELGILAFRHSRLAWSGARGWAATIAAGEGVRR